MPQAKGRQWRFDVLAIAAACIWAPLVRSWPRYSTIFGPWVRFEEADPWLHTRIIERLVANFPHFSRFDPLLIHPGPAILGIAPGLDYLTAGIAMLLGFGHPSASLVEATAAWIPVALSVVSVLGAAAIGRVLGGRWCGAVAALFVATIPGDFLNRTLLGYTDHHAAEVAWTMWAVAAVAAAAAAGKRLEFRLAGAVAALCIALYVATWSSAIVGLVVLAFGAGLAVVVAKQGDEGVIRLLGATAIALAAALLTAALLRGMLPRPEITLLGGVALLAAVAAGIPAVRRLTVKVRATAFASLAVAAVAFTAMLMSGVIRARGPLNELVEQLMRFTRAGKQDYVIEGVGFRDLDAATVYAYLGFLGVAGVVSWLWLAARHRERRSAPFLLVAGWTGGMLIFAIAQARFLYYVLPMLAIGTALALAELRHRGRDLIAAVAVAVILLVSAPQAWNEAAHHSGPSDGWHEALTWLRLNSDSAFSHPDVARANPAPDKAAEWKARWSVMSWWHAGYWIARIAERPPVSNPGQAGAFDAARFLLAGSEEEAAAQVAAPLACRFVIVDGDFQVSFLSGGVAREGFFPSFAAFANQPLRNYYERVELPDGSDTLLFHEKYFRSMAVRLASWGGEAVTPREYQVATLAPPREGGELRRLVSVDRFASEEQARQAIAADKTGQKMLASLDPGESCVSLGALRSLHFVHASPDSGVLVFERSPGS